MSVQPTGHVWRFSVMPIRDPHEQHRSVTSLELLFDLVSVVAVGQAVTSLYRSIIDGHLPQGVVGYAAVFSAIWWAWANWMWFTSAFDNDDTIYRISTFVQMAGALVLAVGVSEAFEGHVGIAVTGYAIMRFAMVGQWLRAAVANPDVRPAALRFAVGVTVVQLLWIARLAIPAPWSWITFVVLAAVELAIPWWAVHGRPLPWHPQHIAERYALFTMIVLGGTVLALTITIKSVMVPGASVRSLVLSCVSGIVVVCSMWWLYHGRPAHRFPQDNRSVFLWSYGYYFVLSSIAAFGAGLAVIVDYRVVGSRFPGLMDLSTMLLGATAVVPVTVFLLSVWALHIRPRCLRSARSATYLLAALLVLLTLFTLVPLVLTALIMIGAVFTVELIQDDI
ncbi:low temperature requirement protein A [Streptosporangium sp. NPDC087985]|uniref:low temperature requirement protein A n=1 Tax=Streptosporangium sp. NPDC087985 TaxID=3366196 RepID=UPI00382D0747